MIRAVFGRHPRPYLAGIFVDERDVEAFLERAPAELRHQLDIVVEPERSLPCFVIESDHELRVVDRGALSHALRRWRDDVAAVAEDPDYVFGNVYFLPSTWMSSPPGTDCMGAISHLHIERRHLEAFARGGLPELLGGWLAADVVIGLSSW